MKLPASVLKSAVKRLAAAGASEFLLDTKAGVFSAAGAGLWIEVHDIELSEKSGHVVAVPAKTFASAVNRARGDIEFAIGKSVLVKGRATFEIPVVVKPPVFPKVEFSEGDVELPLDFLQDAVSFTNQAVSKTSQTYGGAMQVQTTAEGAYAVVAGGGVIPAMRRTFPVSATRSILIPLQAFGAIKSLEGEKILLVDNERMTRITTVVATGKPGAYTVIYAAKQATAFPDINKHFPTAFKFSVELDVEEMREALADMAAMTEDALSSIHLTFDGPILTLTTMATVAGVATTQVAASRPGAAVPNGIEDFLSDDDVPFNIGHNHRYLGGFFASIEEGTVQYHANSERELAMLQYTAKDGTELRLLVAPVGR